MSFPAILPPSKNRQFSSSKTGHFYFANTGHYHFAVTTRIRVIDIAIEYDRLGLTPDQIIDAHPHLTLEAVHDALSYYYENQAVFDEEIRQRKENIKKLSKKFPSKLKTYLG
jgi:uncharacterized protein (DUF433 family)